MRPAILYTLNATKILTGDYHQMMRTNLKPYFTADASETIAFTEDRFAVPVHRVRRITKPMTDPLNTDPWLEDYEDFFFCLEPALSEIIEEPFKHNMREAKRKENEAVAIANIAKGSMKVLQDAVDTFNLKPWWKRAIIAIRYGLKL